MSQIADARLLPITSETVVHEFNTNLENVMNDTNRGVREVLETRTGSSFLKLQQHARQIGINATDVSQISAHYTTEPAKIAREWLNLSLVIDEPQHVKSRAEERVQDRRRPSSRTKDSLADCVILESYLNFVRTYGEKLRSNQAKVVFISSNTSDFCQRAPVGRRSPALHPDIAPEFESLGISFARNMRVACTELLFRS